MTLTTHSETQPKFLQELEKTSFLNSNGSEGARCI